MAIEIKLYNDAIAALQRAAVSAAHEALESVIADVKNDIPLNQGGLQRSVYVDRQKQDGQTHIFIDHNCEYARYIYFGKKMVDAETGKPAFMIYDENGAEIGFRFHKGAKLKATDEDLHLNSGKARWLEPYINGDKKDFVLNKFVSAFKKRTGA